ncbi:hypothetical protein [Vibrio quintilis]|uniref:Uncharacterized protein n=1 Tax=Vibrio quintilis TaxID=1117707 RepID=A0A1M7Z1S3_9VIBR|nr:hypothetical protein [Vibrio quintilis]SHO58762.1 hypothetical protein VQ7734_04534 [Vibrio quintilis]
MKDQDKTKIIKLDQTTTVADEIIRQIEHRKSDDTHNIEIKVDQITVSISVPVNN